MVLSHVSDIQLLHVEDSEIDAIALKRAFRKLNITLPLVRAIDGVEALELLRDLPPSSTCQTVVLLDINMPRMNGHEFLCELRNDPSLRKIPVFILTTSDEPNDIRKAYERNVAGYMVKPIGSGGFLEQIEQWCQYLTMIELPTAL